MFALLRECGLQLKRITLPLYSLFFKMAAKDYMLRKTLGKGPCFAGLLMFAFVLILPGPVFLTEINSGFRAYPKISKQLALVSQQREEDLSLNRGKEVKETREIIRLHVQANSNSSADQQIKNLLAERIIELYSPYWSNHISSSACLRLFLEKNRKEMEKEAEAFLKERGVEQVVAINLEKTQFPARFYQGELYPAGDYEALHVVLGRGNGENWWCVLFPPLCFQVFPAPLKPDVRGDQKWEKAVKTEEKISSLPSIEDNDHSPTAKKNGGKENIRFWLVDTLRRL